MSFSTRSKARGCLLDVAIFQVLKGWTRFCLMQRRVSLTSSLPPLMCLLWFCICEGKRSSTQDDAAERDQKIALPYLLPHVLHVILCKEQCQRVLACSPACFLIGMYQVLKKSGVEKESTKWQRRASLASPPLFPLLCAYSLNLYVWERRKRVEYYLRKMDTMVQKKKVKANEAQQQHLLQELCKPAALHVCVVTRRIIISFTGMLHTPSSTAIWPHRFPPPHIDLVRKEKSRWRHLIYFPVLVCVSRSAPSLLLHYLPSPILSSPHTQNHHITPSTTLHRIPTRSTTCTPMLLQSQKQHIPIQPRPTTPQLRNPSNSSKPVPNL